MDIDQATAKHHRLSTPFDLEHQARLFVATDATAAEAPSGKQRVAYLTHAIHDIVMAAPKQTLVLFNSLNMIEAVFYSLHQTDLPGDREILASREQRVFWVSLNQWHDRGSLTLAGSLIDTQGYFKTQLYPYFSAPLLTGATLFATGKSQYVYSQLDIDQATAKHHRL
ncbi:hypothetical protein WP50_30275, partial [Lactiplantibacillus plantarum]